MITKSPRITSGDLKNKRLKVPNFPDLRIVKDKVRQAIFMILESKIKNAKVADIFCGSGSLGFESISRGAEKVDFVDENYSCVRTLEENAKLLNVTDKIVVHQSKAIGFLGNTSDRFDIIFLDPFYQDVRHKFLLKLAEESLEEGGVIVFLHENADMPSLIEKVNLEIVDERNYGQTTVSFLKRKSIDN